MINDDDVRPALREWVKKKHGGLIVDEMSILWGRGRIDIVAIVDDIIAYEIKAQNDRLDRLRTQVPFFGKVCRWCTVVVDRIHLRRLYNFIPTWWGVIVFEFNGISYCFATLREMKPNPNYDVRLVPLVLWKEELVRYLKSVGINPKTSTSKRDLVKMFLRSIGNRPGVWRETKRLLEERKNDKEWAAAHLKS